MRWLVWIAALTFTLGACGGKEVIGEWQDSQAGGYAATITIYRDSGEPMIDFEFNDGSGMTRELVEKTIGGQRRFEERRSGSDEYYVIDTQGNLKLYDRDGLIRTTVRR